MSLLEERMYGFITQPDNWQLAREISEKMEYVKDRMLKEFWGEVKAKIENCLNPKEWTIEMSDLYETYSYLKIGNRSWGNHMFVALEGLHRDVIIGAFRDLESHKVPDVVHEKMAQDFKAMYKQMEKSDCWSGYFFIGDDFRYGTTLDKILPSNRKALVDKYSNMLIDLKDRGKPIIDEAMRQIER